MKRNGAEKALASATARPSTDADPVFTTYEGIRAHCIAEGATHTGGRETRDGAVTHETFYRPSKSFDGAWSFCAVYFRSHDRVYTRGSWLVEWDGLPTFKSSDGLPYARPIVASREDLYRAAMAADDAWSDELQRLFGKRAGDARYTREGKGEPGTDLRRLHDAKLAADAAMRAAGSAAQS